MIKQLLIAGVSAVALGACGSAYTHSGGADREPTQSPAAAVAQGDYPLMDTPLIRASAQLQREWAPLLTSDGTTAATAMIPGREVFTRMPAAPKSSALAPAMQRTEALVQWAEGHAQQGLVHALQGRAVSSAVTMALNAGQPVMDPPCDVWPMAITTVPETPETDAWFLSAGYIPGPNAVALTLPEGPGCALLINGDQSVAIGAPADATVVDTGKVNDASPLGSVFVVSGARECIDAAHIPGTCD